MGIWNTNLETFINGMISMGCNFENRLNRTQLFSKLFASGCAILISHLVSIYWVVTNQNSVCGKMFGTGCTIRRVLKEFPPLPKKGILFMPVFHSFRSSLSLSLSAKIWLPRDGFTSKFILMFLPKICWHIYFWLISDTHPRNKLLTKNHDGGHAGFKTRLKQHDFRENRRNAWIYSPFPWWYIKPGVPDCRANHKNLPLYYIKTYFLKKLKCL